MAPPASKQALRAALERGEFSPVYYFFGDDDFLKEDALRQLLDAAVDPATKDFNFETRRASELDAGVLGSLLATPPMMAERRAVVIRDVAALKKDARRELDRYLERPASDTLLALVSPAGSKPDKELQGAAVPMLYEPLGEEHVVKWIPHHAGRLGVEVTPGAASLLQSAVGNDLPALAVELEKLASFASSGVVDEEAVEAVVGVRRDETMGALLDAVAERNVRRALELVTAVLQQPKTSAVQIVMALATQTMAIGYILDRRPRKAAVKGELFTFLKGAGSAFTGRPWGQAVDSYAANYEKWTPREVDDALDMLLATDRSLKGTRVSSEEQCLRTAILSLSVRTTARDAA
jgi:DNA polymerase III subunit delta